MLSLMMRSQLIAILIALAACSSDETRSPADAGPDADAAESADADAGARERCDDLEAQYAAVPKAAANVSCTQKEQCTSIHDGICHWLGDRAVNTTGEAAAKAIASAFYDESCNAAILDCGSGGGRTYALGCHDGTCVFLDEDGGVVP